MPVRPRSHQLETQSRQAFERAVPLGWVYRRKDGDDYGIDGEVEVFDDAGLATGIQFLVQLKATDGEPQPRGLIRRVPIGHVAYYRSLALPVLMVGFRAKDGALFGRWFHNHESYGVSGETKSIAFDWKESDRLSAERIQSLGDETQAFLDVKSASLQLPMRFALDIESLDDWGLSDSEIRIAVRAAVGKRPDVLQLASEAPPRVSGRLTVRPGRLGVQLADVTGAGLVIDADYEPGPQAEHLARDLLALAALAFDQVGQCSAASRVAASYLPRSILSRKPDAMAALAAAFTHARLVRESLILSDELDSVCETDGDDVALLFVLPAVEHSLSLAPDEVSLHRTTLEARVARREDRGDTQGAGREAYNVANHLRSTGDQAGAIEAYERAARLDRSYEGRDYYWAEFAGVLFGSRRYAEAVVGYERALSLKPSDWTRALLADALLFAGDYASALRNFDVALRAFDRPGRGDEWLLKSALARELVEIRGFEKQVRQTEAADSIAPTFFGDVPESLNIIRGRVADVLKLDALAGFAWFMLGLSESKDGTQDVAANAFLFAALIAERDPEVWALALMAAVNAGFPAPRCSAILATGERLTSHAMIPAAIAASKDFMDQGTSREFVKQLDAMQTALPDDRDHGYAVRSIREDGQGYEGLLVPGLYEHLPESAVRTSPKVGRNELCPCGTGVKFKRCHGA